MPTIQTPRGHTKLVKSIQDWHELNRWASSLDRRVIEILQSLDESQLLFSNITATVGKPIVGSHAVQHKPVSGADPLDTNAPSGMLGGTSSNDLGTADAFSQSDHSHDIETAAPTGDFSGASEGSGNALLRADANFPPAGLPYAVFAGTYATAAVEGVADSVLRSDATLTYPDSLMSAVDSTVALTDSGGNQTLTGNKGKLIITPDTFCEITEGTTIKNVTSLSSNVLTLQQQNTGATDGAHLALDSKGGEIPSPAQGEIYRDAARLHLLYNTLRFGEAAGTTRNIEVVNANTGTFATLRWTPTGNHLLVFPPNSGAVIYDGTDTGAETIQRIENKRLEDATVFIVNDTGLKGMRFQVQDIPANDPVEDAHGVINIPSDVSLNPGQSEMILHDTANTFTGTNEFQGLVTLSGETDARVLLITDNDFTPVSSERSPYITFRHNEQTVPEDVRMGLGSTGAWYLYNPVAGNFSIIANVSEAGGSQHFDVGSGKVRFKTGGTKFHMLSGSATDDRDVTFPDADLTVAGLELTQIFTGINTFDDEIILSPPTGAGNEVHINFVDKTDDPASPDAGDLWRNGKALNFYNGTNTTDLISQLRSAANDFTLTLTDNGTAVTLANSGTGWTLDCTGILTLDSNFRDYRWAKAGGTIMRIHATASAGNPIALSPPSNTGTSAIAAGILSQWTVDPSFSSDIERYASNYELFYSGTATGASASVFGSRFFAQIRGNMGLDVDDELGAAKFVLNFRVTTPRTLQNAYGIKFEQDEDGTSGTIVNARGIYWPGWTNSGTSTFTNPWFLYNDSDDDIYVGNDNAKLIFGTGLDDEIYHDGTDLVIKPAGEVKIGATGNRNMHLNDIEIDGDLNHDGSNIGFFGTAPAAQVAAYTPTNVSADRSYDADSTSIDELADVLGTLIADLQSYGLLQ